MEKTMNTESTEDMNLSDVDKKVKNKIPRKRTAFSDIRISYMKDKGKDVSGEYEKEEKEE